MSENSSNKSGVIILVSGILFIVVTILVLFGMGKYTSMFKDKAVEVIKESAPVNKSGTTELKVGSADSTHLDNSKIGTSETESSNLEVGGKPADYGFKMDMEKSAQQEEAIEKYSFPTVPAGQPGSQEWQESFWKER